MITKLCLISVVVLLIQCTSQKKQFDSQSVLPNTIEENYSLLKELEKKAFGDIDIIECPDKYPEDIIGHWQISGKIHYFKSILDSAGYKAQWDCVEGGYSLHKK